jgi:hypothetical protein
LVSLHAQPLNTLPKYVATTTLSEPLNWQNSKVLQGDVAQAVARLKTGQDRFTSGERPQWPVR